MRVQVLTEQQQPEDRGENRMHAHEHAEDLRGNGTQRDQVPRIGQRAQHTGDGRPPQRRPGHPALYEKDHCNG
ncbi:hypothetical protein GCM10010435_17960 [Winogradskya consettensis]|uniref:Uncharacterized protein n=1 Tax=Winogradskya consettensis TaxID=113560 RepID=A0A919SVT2_9ACTN|nr:hypothetical protein Aco04nite_61090 [Actinoplanes consettensis]